MHNFSNQRSTATNEYSECNFQTRTIMKLKFQDRRKWILDGILVFLFHSLILVLFNFEKKVITVKNDMYLITREELSFVELLNENIISYTYNSPVKWALKWRKKIAQKPYLHRVVRWVSRSSVTKLFSPTSHYLLKCCDDVFKLPSVLFCTSNDKFQW